MAKGDGLEFGITVHECKDCEYKNGAKEIYLDPESDMIILEPQMLISREHRDRILQDIGEQILTGVIMVPNGFKVTVAPIGTTFAVGTIPEIESDTK